LTKFEIGEWFWFFYQKIFSGSCNKLRSYWARLYKIIRKISLALVEVIEVYEKGNPKLVGIDVLKEFREDNSAYGFLVIPHTLQYRKQMR